MYSLWNTESKSKLPPLMWQAPLAACSLPKYLIPHSFFSLNFLPFQIVDAFQHVMRSFGGERADTTFWATLNRAFFQNKKSLQGYFLKSIAVLPLFPHFLHQWCFSSPASSFSPALCLCPRWRAGWPHSMQCWDDWTVWLGYQHQQGSLMLSEQGASFQT